MNSLLQRGSPKLALMVAKAANELFPTESQSGFDYGALLMLTEGEPDEARAVLEESLRRPGRRVESSLSSRPLALNNLGRLALVRGDFPAARAHLAEALKLDGANATVLYNLAAADQRAGDAPACRNHILAALERDPKGATRDDYLVAAWAYNESGLFHDAASLLGRAIREMPNSSGLHLNLGYAHTRGGMPFDALLEYLYEFENGSPGDPYAREARREFTEALGDPGPVTGGADPVSPSAPGPREVGAAPPGQSPIDPAGPDTRGKPTETKPDQTEAIRLLRAAMQGDSADPARVLADLDRLEAAGYHHVTLDLLRAEALYAGHDVSRSETLLRKMIADDAAFLPPYFDLTVILRAAGKDEEARRIVAQAVKRNPSHWQLVGGVPPSFP